MSPCRAEARAEDARSALTRGPSRSYPWWSPSIRPQPTHTCFRRARSGSPETGVGGLRRFRKAMDGARIAFSTHGQPRPSTRFAGPPLRSGPAG